MSLLNYGQNDIEQKIRAAAQRYDIDPDLLAEVGRQESSFKSSGESSAGARGPLQLLPSTFAQLGGKNIDDVDENIDMGAKYFKQQLDRYSGDHRKALGAYHAGPGAVDPIKGAIPSKGYGPKTQNYVDTISKRYENNKLFKEADGILGVTPQPIKKGALDDLLKEGDGILGNAGVMAQTTQPQISTDSNFEQETSDGITFSYPKGTNPIKDLRNPNAPAVSLSNASTASQQPKDVAFDSLLKEADDLVAGMQPLSQPKAKPVTKSQPTSSFNYQGAPLDLNFDKVNNKKPTTIADRIISAPTQANQPTRKLSVGDLRAMENRDKPRSVGGLKVIENREAPQAKALAKQIQANNAPLTDKVIATTAGFLNALPIPDLGGVEADNKFQEMIRQEKQGVSQPRTPASLTEQAYGDVPGYGGGQFAGGLVRGIGSMALGGIPGMVGDAAVNSFTSSLKQQGEQQDLKDISLVEAAKEGLKGGTKAGAFGAASKLPFVNQVVGKIAGGAGAGTSRAVAGALARPVLTGVENAVTSAPIDIGVDAAYDAVTGDDSLSRNQYVTDPTGAVKRDLVTGAAFQAPAAIEGYRGGGIQEGARALATGEYSPTTQSQPISIVATNEAGKGTRLAEVYQGANGLEYRELGNLNSEQMLDLAINSKTPIKNLSSEEFNQRLAGRSESAPTQEPQLAPEPTPEPTQQALPAETQPTKAPLPVEQAPAPPPQEATPLATAQPKPATVKPAESQRAESIYPPEVQAKLDGLDTAQATDGAVKPLEALKQAEPLAPEAKPELPKGVTRADLRTSLLQREMKDAGGRTLKGKEAEDHIDHVLTITDAFARSTGKSVDDFYRSIQRIDVKKGRSNQKGATQLLDNGQVVLHLFEKADASTVIHEMTHILRPHLKPDEIATLGNWLESQGVGNPKNGKWTPAQDELVARAVERLMVTGELPTNAPPKLQEAFSKVKGWMTDIYSRVEKKIPISGKLRKFFSDINFDEPSANIFKNRLVEGHALNEADALAAKAKVEPTAPVTEPLATKPATPVEAPSAQSKTQTRGLYKSAEPYLTKPLSETLQTHEYTKITNKEAFGQANSLIAKNYDEALALATNPQIEQGKAHVQNAVALELLRDAEANGEVGKAQSIIRALAARGTDAGQAAQILTNIARISPEGVSRYVNSLINKEALKVSEGLRSRAEKDTSTLLDKVNNPPEDLNLLFQKTVGAPKLLADSFAEKIAQAKNTFDREQVIREFVSRRYGIPALSADAATNISKMARDLQTKTGDERKEAIALLGKYIGEQIPKTAGEKFKFLMRTFDLFNPGGAALNTASDLAFRGLERVSGRVAAGLDALAVKTGIAKERSIVDTQKQKGEYWNNLKLSTKEIVKGIDTSQAIDDRFETGGSPAFKGKWAKYADIGVKLGYGATQNASFRTFKAESIRNQMKVAEMNGKKLTEPTAEIIERAEKEALDKTLSDSNFFTESLSTIQKTLNKASTLGKSSEIGLGTALVTYTKVPANLLKKGIEFSPLGLGKVAKEMVQHERYKMSGGTKGKEIDQREFVQSLARVLTGTVGAVGLGALLHRAGVLVKDADEGDERKLQKLQNETGIAGYKMNVNAGARWAKTLFTDSSVTEMKQGDWLARYDFLQPHGFLLSLGANLDETLGKTYNYLRGRDDKTTVLDLVSQYTDNGLEVLSDVGVIQSLRKAGQLSDLADNNKRGSYAKNFAGNLIARPIPALIRQTRNYVDNTKRETYDPNSGINTVTNKVKDNLPWASKTLPAQKTTFGEDKQRVVGNEGLIRSAFDSFLAGGRITNYKTDPETKYLIELAQTRREAGSTKPDSHIPTPPKQFDIDGKKVKPTPMQKSMYQDLLGHAAKDLVKRVNEVPKFKELSPDGQGAFIADYLGEINKAVKHEVFKTKSERKQVALDNVLPKSEAVFEHNITVKVEEEKAAKALETNSDLKRLYGKLNDVQKEHADSTIKALFTKLQVQEKPKTPAKEVEGNLREKQTDLKNILRDIQEKLREAADYDPDEE